ncbi:MAG: peptide-methionine (S)-S-oxide reductase MsrA [Chlorobi bacterium]|nr:peptide-methionine (S)-S-oxide reductase MsrA [Chlorobiota bacterium]
MRYLLLNIIIVFFMATGNLSGQPKTETITFGAGCFWCVEAAFQRIKGVTEVESGYMGGTKENPTYKEVCTGETGHAEVVKITYYPDSVSFGELLRVFFTVHDPTTLNRQGNDVGTQYRSAIFYYTDTQKKEAEETIKKLNNSGIYDSPIVTEVTKAGEFYPAEDYHHDYYNNNSDQPYCRIVITPKLRKVEKELKELLRK